MAQHNYDLAEILNIPLWERVQDWLAKTTGTAIITIDYKGTPITKHSLRTEFCGIIRSNPVSRKRCFKCDALAGLEAVRSKRPYIYLCHCGIVDVAVPVTVDDIYLGAVMFGEVRIPNGDPENKVERLISEISSFQPENEQASQDLKELYNKLPEMEYERIEDIAYMIQSIVDYIVHMYLENRTRALTYDWMLRSAENAEHIRLSAAEIEELLPSGRIPLQVATDENTRVKRSSPIYPAVAYVENHLDQRITTRDMASLCNLSNSYFSRIFCRDTGETFRDYVNRRKIEKAKEMLNDPNISVSAVSDKLGFMDTSYFVKIFRKYEGITPLVYKQHKFR